jgi:hypothetical protein
MIFLQIQLGYHWLVLLLEPVHDTIHLSNLAELALGSPLIPLEPSAVVKGPLIARTDTWLERWTDLGRLVLLLLIA